MSKNKTEQINLTSDYISKAIETNKVNLLDKDPYKTEHYNNMALRTLKYEIAILNDELKLLKK